MDTLKNIVIVKDAKSDKETLLSQEKQSPVEVLVLTAGYENTINGESSSSDIREDRYSTTVVLLISVVITVTCLIGALGFMAVVTQPRADKIPDNNIMARSDQNEGFLGIAIIDISFSTVEEDPEEPAMINKIDGNIKNVEPDTSLVGGRNDADINTEGSLKNDNDVDDVLKPSDVFNDPDNDGGIKNVLDDFDDDNDVDVNNWEDFSDEESDEFGLDNKPEDEKVIHSVENFPYSDFSDEDESDEVEWK